MTDRNCANCKHHIVPEFYNKRYKLTVGWPVCKRTKKLTDWNWPSCGDGGYAELFEEGYGEK